MNTPSFFPRRGFSLTEILIVVAIVAVLAALLLPTLSQMPQRARVAQSLSNLRQIGAAFQMYSGDNDGFIPAVSSGQNKTSDDWIDNDPWWSQCLTRYVGGKDFPRRWEIPETPFTDPVYRAMVGKEDSPGWRGGYSMNERINLVRGETFGQFHAESSRNRRYKFAAIRGDSVLVTMGYWEGFSPANDGSVADVRFSRSDSRPVPHNRRIGANRRGLGGRSALYLFADGSVKNLTPAEAQDFLRQRL